MNQDKIWEAYQNDPDLEDMGCWGNARIDFIVGKIPTGATVLNIGVGQGKLEELLIAKNVEVFSLDPSETSIARIRDKVGVGDVRAKVGYSQDIPFPDNKFDFVIMTEVLEHLGDGLLNDTLAHVHRVLRSSGKFFGTVPADENLKANMVVCPECGKKFHRWGHAQSFSIDCLAVLLNAVFPTVYVKRKYFFHFQKLNWKGKTLAVFKVIQALLNYKGGNQNLYFEAYK